MIVGKSYKEEVAKTNLNKKELQSIDSTIKWGGTITIRTVK